MYKQAWNNIIRKIEEEVKPYLDAMKDGKECQPHVRTDSLNLDNYPGKIRVGIRKDGLLYKELIEFNVDGLIQELSYVQCDENHKLVKPIGMIRVYDNRTPTQPGVQANNDLFGAHQFLHRYGVRYDQYNFAVGAIKRLMVENGMKNYITAHNNVIQRRWYPYSEWRLFIDLPVIQHEYEEEYDEEEEYLFENAPWLQACLLCCIEIPDDLQFTCKVDKIWKKHDNAVTLYADISDANN